MTRQVKIQNDHARFIEYLIAIWGSSETFASVIGEALEDKYRAEWDAFVKKAGIDDKEDIEGSTKIE